MNPVTFFVIIVTSFFVNFLNARYIKYIAEKKVLKAAIYSELVVIAVSITTINYVHNFLYIIPMIIGGFIGTLFSSVEK